ncbi:MAG: alpha/beta hydrolase [Pseudomonadota bacterium]
MTISQFERFIFTAKDGNRRTLAYQKIEHQSTKPDIMWLSGFKSDMLGSKVAMLTQWAEQNGYGMLRFDYSGHGQSEGAFEAGTIETWLEDATALFCTSITRPCILVGSSMGGWLSLLMAKYLSEENSPHFKNICGLVMIAPACDFTEDLMWAKFDDAIRAELQSKGVYHKPSAHDDGGYPISLELIENGRKHLLKNAVVPIQGPVRILHGVQDPDVPWQRSLDLINMLESPDVVLHLIKDAEHRLSRPQDVARLLASVEEVAEIIEDEKEVDN